ncbi:MAG: hypothetical protein RR036_04555, partial [Oscillospiraceae bacterium]
YMGAGCPDVRRRPLQFAARNDNYSIIVSVNLKEEFSLDNVVAVFDLNNDPGELKNKRKQLIKNADVIKLIDAIKNRHKQLQQEYSNK